MNDDFDSNYDDYNDFHSDLDLDLDSGDEDNYDVIDESMDGDHDSAMTSCGWGTDEDYGCYGEWDDDGDLGDRD